MRRRTTLRSSTRSTVVRHSAEEVREVVAGAGPGRHWYLDALPFVVRGALDRLLGGSGRSHLSPDRALLEAGDHAGFWSVETSAPYALVLRAEVRAPGTVRLRVEWSSDGSHTRVEQTVTFEPSGVIGMAYLLADLPAREAVVELAQRRLARDLA